MNTDHLRAFVVAVDEGTFDAAAALLRISGSAFSQRIKALEKEVGQVLLTRTVPVRPTQAGTELLGTARQMLLLEDEARRSLGFRGPSEDYAPVITLPVAVNADSLASWFIQVLREAATWDDVELHLHAEDQEHTHELLRNGTVLAAVAENPVPVSGCRVMPLGTMQYWPVASRELLERHTMTNRAVTNRAATNRAATDRTSARRPRIDWSRVPLIDYSIRDSLQRAGLQKLGVTTTPITHLVPSVEAYNAAVWHGLGWGMIPEGMMPAGVLDGEHPDLTVIEEIGPTQAQLNWQRWSTSTPALDRLTSAVERAARRML